MISKSAPPVQRPTTFQAGRAASAGLTPQRTASPTRARFDALVKTLLPENSASTPRPPNARVKPLRGPSVSLIGLPNGELDPKASYRDNLARLKRQGIPRFEHLPQQERVHETAFATEVLRDVEHYVAGAELLSKAPDQGLAIIEVDGLKRLYGPYGAAKKPETAEQRTVRAEANHALHPTAVALARLTFLKKLDELEALPPWHPRKQVFVTNGGCAAGKGNLTDLVKRQLGDIPFGAVWDAAGEGNSLENAWVLEACLERGIKVVFGFAANDPLRQYRDVLARGDFIGRVPDVVTYAGSYDPKSMKDFLESPRYLEAARAGLAVAVGVFAGPFDVASLKDPSKPAYPQVRTLGKEGVITARDLPPSRARIIEAALNEVERFLAARKWSPDSPDVVVKGALGLATKFRSEIP